MKVRVVKVRVVKVRVVKVRVVKVRVVGRGGFVLYSCCTTDWSVSSPDAKFPSC